MLTIPYERKIGGIKFVKLWTNSAKLWAFHAAYEKVKQGNFLRVEKYCINVMLQNQKLPRHTIDLNPKGHDCNKHNSFTTEKIGKRPTK